MIQTAVSSAGPALSQVPGETGRAPGAVAVDVADDDAERYLFDMINQERRRSGRQALARNPALDALARLKAWDMAHNRYFDHVSPRFGTVFDMLSENGIAFKWAGENIARAPEATAAHEAFMESPDHRANILSAGYSDVGIGVVRMNGKLYVCQIFMKPRLG